MLKIIGHRFFTEHHPENSTSGIQYSIKNKVWAVETDIQLTKDKVPVLIHDKLLDRTTNFKGYVRDFTFSELQKDCRLENGETIPSLESCLISMKDKNIRLYLELISTDAYESIKEILNHYNNNIEIVISSFHHKLIADIKKCNPSQLTMALFECAPISPLSFVNETLANEVGLGFDSITEDMVKTLQAGGIDVYAWTVNDPLERKQSEQLELTGIFTDSL